MLSILRKLNVSLLPQDEVDRAYPLIQAALPGATIEAWRSFAAMRLGEDESSKTGILYVRNEQSYIVGLGAYMTVYDLQHGPILFADHLCAMDIVDQSSVARALLRAMERIAEQQGCYAIHTALPQSDVREAHGWITNIFHERGHCIRGLQMCKLVASAS